MRDDSVGKLFIMVFTNGDLPTNPVCVRECLVWGEFFTCEEAREHSISRACHRPHSPLPSLRAKGNQVQRLVEHMSVTVVLPNL
jgi:hypothetical protein